MKQTKESKHIQKFTNWNKSGQHPNSSTHRSSYLRCVLDDFTSARPRVQFPDFSQRFFFAQNISKMDACLLPSSDTETKAYKSLTFQSSQRTKTNKTNEMAISKIASSLGNSLQALVSQATSCFHPCFSALFDTDDGVQVTAFDDRKTKSNGVQHVVSIARTAQPTASNAPHIQQLQNTSGRLAAADSISTPKTPPHKSSVKKPAALQYSAPCAEYAPKPSLHPQTEHKSMNSETPNVPQNTPIMQKKVLPSQSLAKQKNPTQITNKRPQHTLTKAHKTTKFQRRAKQRWCKLLTATESRLAEYGLRDALGPHWKDFVSYAKQRFQTQWLEAFDQPMGCQGPLCNGGPCPHQFRVDPSSPDDLWRMCLLHLDHQTPLHRICCAWNQIIREHDTLLRWDQGVDGELVCHLLFGMFDHPNFQSTRNNLWKANVRFRCHLSSGNGCHDMKGLAHHAFQLDADDLRSSSD